MVSEKPFENIEEIGFGPSHFSHLPFFRPQNPTFWLSGSKFTLTLASWAVLWYLGTVMKAQLHVYVSSDVKRNAAATAMVHGYTLSAFVQHALEFTMHSMAEQGLEVVTVQAGAKRSKKT